jgi:hypothetical protein
MSKIKQEIIDKIATDYKLRSDIGRDCDLHERTIQRWAKDEPKKLETKSIVLVLSTYFPEHETILEEE